MQLKLLGSKEIVRFVAFGMGRNSLPKTGRNDAERLILLGILQGAGKAVPLSQAVPLSFSIPNMVLSYSLPAVKAGAKQNPKDEGVSLDEVERVVI